MYGIWHHAHIKTSVYIQHTCSIYSTYRNITFKAYIHNGVIHTGTYIHAQRKHATYNVYICHLHTRWGVCLPLSLFPATHWKLYIVNNSYWFAWYDNYRNTRYVETSMHASSCTLCIYIYRERELTFLLWLFFVVIALSWFAETSESVYSRSYCHINTYINHTCIHWTVLCPHSVSIPMYMAQVFPLHLIKYNLSPSCTHNWMVKDATIHFKLQCLMTLQVISMWHAALH